MNLSEDCYCKNNDPECAECWDSPSSKITRAAAHPSNRGCLPGLCEPVFETDVRNRFDECRELLLRKHKDYSGRNIAQSPGGPLNGLRVRMHDKISRINNLIDNGTAPEYEPLRDSFLDLANYAVIALLVIDKAWPTE